MKKKRVLPNRTSRVRRQRDPIPWKYCALTTICGLLLLGGFFAAAKQHFSAVGYAMDNANLRLRITKLKDEKRKLVLARERASSPARIAGLAKKIGFTTVPRIIAALPPMPERIATGTSDEAPRYMYVSEPATVNRLRDTAPSALNQENPTETKISAGDHLIETSSNRISQIASLIRSQSLTSKK